MTTGPDGKVRALDGRQLYLHAKTAGFLASAELRHQLTARLGVGWGEVVHGIAEIAGVPEAAIRASSSRSVEIDRLTGELGLGGAAARQVAAYQTRHAKDTAVDPADLRHRWADLFGEVGFTGEYVARRVLGRRTTLREPGTEAVARWYEHLGSARGVTEQSSTFDRRHVVQHVAELAGDQMDARAIEDVADRWLSSGDVEVLSDDLAAERSNFGIVRRDGRTVRTPTGLRLYTTPQLLALEDRVLAAVAAGFGTGHGVVDETTITAVIAVHETSRGGRLGDDQRAMVHAVCTSGDAVQCVLGPAGSGKTYALAAAAQAWQKAGFTVWGASVNGTAAEQLARATAIPTRTLASLLNRLDLADHPVLTDGHVIVVDEASTIGSRNLARLLRHTTAAGATVRLVGDPAQHSAIDAGGVFRALVDRHPERTPVLAVLRRRAGDDVADIRLALTDYRQGRLAEAWQRLQDNARIVTALLDAAGHDLIGGDVGQLGGHDELRCVAGRVGRPTGRHRRLCGGAGCRAVAGGVAAQATVQVPRSRHEMSWWQGAVDQQGVARLQHTQEVAGDEWPVDGRVVHGAAAAGVEVGGDRPVADLLTAEYKARILDEYAALPVGSSERGALLRSEALYSSHLAEWRKARDAGAATPWPQRRSRVFPLEQVALERLRRRNERLETELAKTRSALDVIGKLHALLEGLSESADTDPKSTR